MQQASERSIVRSALLRVLPLSALILVVIWMIAAHQVRDALEEGARQRLQSEARFVTKEITGRFKEIQRSLSLLAENELILNGLFDQQNREQYLQPLFRSLRLPGPSGIVALTDYKGRPLITSSGTASVPALDMAELARGELIVISATSALVAVGVHKNGSLEGAIVVDYGPDAFPDLFGIEIEGMLLRVSDEGGGVLYRSSGGVADSISYRTVLTEVPGVEVTIGRSEKGLMAHWDGLTTLLFLAFGLDLVALAVGIVSAALLIGRPLRELAAQLSKVRGADDLPEQLSLRAPREVAVVLAALNRSFQLVRVQTDERKRVAEELSRLVRQNSLLVATIDATTVGVTIADATAPDTPIIFCNPAFSRITGFSRSEAIGSNCRFLNGPKTDPATRDLIRETIRRGEPLTVEVLNRKKDGSEFWNLLSLFPLRETGGQVSHIVGVQTDITLLKASEADRAALERNLVESRRLESLGSLAGGIAHEINTPVQFVGDNIRFLQDSIAGFDRVISTYRKHLGEAVGTPDALAEIEAVEGEVDLDFCREEAPLAVSQALEGIDRIAHIVQAVKQFSHPGTEGRAAFDINKAIENTVTVARNQWKYVAKMDLDLDPSLPRLFGLEGEINQALLNLIVNAAQAIEETGREDGQISIRTGLVDGAIEVAITDSGAGIAEEIRHRLFDMFFTTKPPGKGTGQGLALVDSVVRQKHGGRIELQSELGKGTTFRLLFPLSSDETALAA